MAAAETRGFDAAGRRRHAWAILRTGLQAVAPAPVTQRAVHGLLSKQAPAGRLLLLGAGKAAEPMLAGALAAIDTVFGPEGLGRVSGLLIGPPGSREQDGAVAVAAGGHPLPSAAGARAAARMLACARGADRDDLVVVLLSGGASALMSLPAEGLGVEDLQRTSEALLASGAPIGDVNTVRRHLSAIAGGLLGAATAPAPTLVLVVSDVVGDDLAAIGSGPAYGDSSTFADALRVVRERGLEDALPPAVAERLRAGTRGEIPETPLPDALSHVEHRLVARNLDACRAMASEAAGLGYEPLIVSHTLEGEARELGVVHAGLAASVVADGVPLDAPCALITGGEATVTLRGRGRGGRNQESALAAAPGLAGLPATFLSAGTDGVDGPTDAAGGLVDGGTAALAAERGIDIGRALERNDSGSALDALDARIVTGPTGTNVADVRLILVGRDTG